MAKKEPLPLSAVWNQLDKLFLHESQSSSERSSSKVDNVTACRVSTSSDTTYSRRSQSESSFLREHSTASDHKQSSSKDRRPHQTKKYHRNFETQKHKTAISVSHEKDINNEMQQNINQFHGRHRGNLQNRNMQDRQNFHGDKSNRNFNKKMDFEQKHSVSDRNELKRPISDHRNMQDRQNFHGDKSNRNFNKKMDFEQKHSVSDRSELKRPISDRSKPAHPIGFKALEELVKRPPNEIVLMINQKNCGFMSLIKQDNIRPDLMALILISLGRACSANLNQNICSLLNSVCSNDNFLLISIQKYLVSFRQNQIKDFHLESLSCLTSFLQKFQHTLPSSSSEPISMLLPLLQSTCENFLKTTKFYDSVMIKLTEIREENDRYISKYTPSEIKKASKREALQLQEPPENFRSIPILPSADDIYCNAFLRPNIVEGKYSDTEQYLDIQYRLLREDYVKPLRDGIAHYLILKKDGKSVKNCKDVRVYENVHIVKQDYVNGGMVHIAQFDDKSFNKIKWEYSKRFLSGSLLCLSSDNFKTMLFASVAQRDPDQLKKKLLLIRFEDGISDEVLNITPLRSFVIIETTAYFEAYRHNLKALHELKEDVLPLKKYIIDVEKNVGFPEYLQPNTTYDFRPLLLPINDDTFIKHVVASDGDVSVQYDFPVDVIGVFKSIHVLKDSEWPSASALNLDQSQYLALKAGITKEFAIIQGPPGTGKTYIGLRIVQLLLHNLNIWFSKLTNALPILVVCFTNHALDQFLEGLMRFTDKIVRIGGRGMNDKVSKYQLSNLKKNAMAKKEFPRYISDNMWRKRFELKELKNEIDKINRFAENSLTVVYGEREIVCGKAIDVIPRTHLISLRSILSVKEYNLSDDGLLIHDWLGIRSRVGWGPEMFEVEPVNVQKTNKDIFTPKVEDDIDDEIDNESTDEADIEFIEAQRDIDPEEYADVSFEIETVEEEFILSDDAGWQVQGGRKQRLKYIKNCLKNYQPLEEKEALKITHLWNLSVPKRWQLYKFWIQRLVEKKQEEVRAKQQSFKEKYTEICEMRTEEDICILNKAHIVGMTTTGAAKYRDIVLRLNPQILVVEEAAEILESHIVTSLAPNTQHVILIGDQQQLRPSPTVHMLAVKYHLNISLFERMLKNHMDYFRLSVQHRMRPEVAALIVPHIYKDLENHESVTKYENIKGVGKNVFFITHDCKELQESDSKSKINEHEAKFLVKLCKYFVLQGYDPSQITVLTTYSGQLFAMKKLVTDSIRKVRFTVVDNFQGEENDIILISFVRSNEEGEIGFLKVENRVCVALSRARKGLFCIGNFELLAEKSTLWENIVNTLHQKQAIGSSLQLVCQNHPSVCNVVANEKDFESVPEGGCTKACEYRLSCGHACSLMCHPYDKLHENVRCHKECSKTCAYGHKCRRKCFEKCGPCVSLVDKTFFPCGHTIKIQCSRQNDPHIKCTAACDRFLLCGHKCSNKCFEPCSSLCNKIISIKSPICEHKVSVECRFKCRSEELMKVCKEPCNVILNCGHPCKGNCCNCHQGRLHVACNQPCKRILVCGHECKSPCAKSCPPCKVPCENRCIHSKCPKTCGEPCEVCTEPCEWHCKHHQCSRSCGELCNRVPCNKPCLKLLTCGHPCIGFCGEPCPKECRNCDSEKVKEIFFGTEEDDDARFICLEDCNHIIEISGLNEWIKADNKGDHEIQMKVCPKCKSVIRTNLRFGNIVKECLRKIECVKRKTFGIAIKNREKQNELLEFLKKNIMTLQILKKGSVYETWTKTVSSKTRCRNIYEITTMENIFHIAIELADVVQYVNSGLAFVNEDPSVKEGLEVLFLFIYSSQNFLLDFIHDDYLTASEQQVKQLTWEVHRLQLGKRLLKFVKGRRLMVSSDPDFEKCISVLIKYSPFDEKDSEEFKTAYKHLAEKCGSAVINISELEKRSILKAMNLSVGHWYQCPNGHVYCITECGGAMEQARCNECNAEIGGTNHSLLRSNRVATAMDGARHGAWSDAMNMENYQIDNNYDHLF